MASASPKRRVVLAVGAHPDDVEISCAGTLKALKNVGYVIHIASMSLGDCGSKELPPDGVRTQRRSEAEAACRILGAEYHYVGSNDFSIFTDDVHNRRVTALLRSVAPQIVFTHAPGDYMLDHDNTSVLVRNACFQASVPNYDCSQFGASSAIADIPHLYYWDVMEGMNIFGKPVAPAFYVNITPEMDLKSELLGAHRSQREWLRAQHGIDEYIETMHEWAAGRGKEARAITNARTASSHAGKPRRKPVSIMYAEAFRQHLGHAYPHDNALAGLLRDRVITNPDY